MVGIVVVSHSDALAQGVVALAREMGGSGLALEAAGGTAEPGVLGTDAERVREAIERAMSDDGVLVLMDLGSALMSAEFAVELLGETAGKVLLSEAPLVEGAVAAAAAASGGASLEEVAAEARGALAMKSAQLGVAEDGGPPAAPAPRRLPPRMPRPRSASATRSGCTPGRRRGSSRPCAGSTPMCAWPRPAAGRRCAPPASRTWSRWAPGSATRCS